MRCEEIMKRDIHCVSPQTSSSDAARRMRDQNIGFLPVCQPAGRVIGTVTDRDLAVRLVAANRPITTPVEEIMSSELVFCRPNDDLHHAEELMAEHHKSRILCIDPHGTLAGVISLSDVAQHEGSVRSSETLREISRRESRV